MKKVFLTIALAAFAFAANAQLIVGGNIGYTTNGGSTVTTNVNGNTTTEINYPGTVDFTIPTINHNRSTLTILPKVGYQLNDNMQVGAALGITWNKDVNFNPYAAQYAAGIENFEGWERRTQMGIQIAPYFRYNLTEFGNFTLFCEAQLAFTFGLNPTIHNYHTAYTVGVTNVDAVDEDIEGVSETSTSINLTVVPGLNYKLNDNFSVDLYLNFIGLAFNHTTTREFTDWNVVNDTPNNPTDTDEIVTNTNNFGLVANMGGHNLMNIFTIGFNYHF